ncbi:MAG: (2Fe-2S)-binding protein [Deltaproteobacteria bacterium]|nr:(2Fe-2S)-binding protein [Deltaproteobacteria bacterium]
MDITDEDIAQAIAEGFDHLETLKRYTAVLMGPCQGKVCAMNVLREFARLTGKTVAELQVPTLRPPLRPLPLGLLEAKREDTHATENPASS